MTNHYIADTHFGHENIIRFCDRPFSDVDEMNRRLVEAWNARVSDDDDVYVIGDFAFKSAEHVGSILDRLSGRKHLCVGNHDIKWMKTLDVDDYFVEVGHALYTVDDARRRIWMCHYPCMDWPGAKYESSYHVFGHIHNNVCDEFWPLLRTYTHALNVGVEINGFMPVTLEELIVNNERWREESGKLDREAAIAC